MRRSGSGCGKGGTDQADMAELDPRVGKSGTEDIVGEDEGDEVLLFDWDDVATALLVFVFCCLELLDEEKMALNIVLRSPAAVARCRRRVASE